MLESESEEEEREDERDTGQPLTLASDPPLSIPLVEISGGIFSLGVSKTPRAASRERGTAKDISGQKRIGQDREGHAPVVVNVVGALHLTYGKDVRVHSVNRESPIPNGLTTVAAKRKRVEQG